MKIQYEQQPKLKAETLELIAACDDIISHYQSRGYDLFSLRQLHYGLVSKQPLSDEYENTHQSYKRLGKVVTNARMYGMLPWNALTDRTRAIDGGQHWDNVGHLLEDALKSFRLDRWQEQPYRVECWVEKDALIGVVQRACKKVDIDYFSCRGYTSASSLWRASQRFLKCHAEGQDVVVLHLADHDPSGLDMSRDIVDRLHGFGVPPWFELRRIALNIDQVSGLVPNPTKVSDSRAAEYISEYGHESWELDALEPEFLEQLIIENVEDLRDDNLFRARLDEESAQLEEMHELVSPYWP